MSLRVSQKHGVNPSVDHCFWCGADIGVALLGQLPNDAQAPRDICTSYDPCLDCQSKMALGVTVVEVDPATKHPTGKWCVITEEAARRLFENTPLVEKILSVKRVSMAPETYGPVFGAFGDIDNTNQTPN